MSSLKVTGQTSCAPFLAPLGYKKQHIFKAFEETAIFFEQALSLISHKSYSYAETKKIIAKLKPLDHRCRCFFSKKKKLSNAIDKLDLEIPLRDVWKTYPHKLENLCLELPHIPFFHHPHPFNNVLDHQKLYEAEVDKKPYVAMQTIEHLAADFFQNLEFFTVPLCSAHIFETIDQDTLTALRFKLPPLTLKFIVRSLLTRDYPIRCRELGEGAYGRVFLVKNKVSLYAYKEFKKDPTGAFLADPSLLQETFIHLVLPKHPSIVQVQAVNCEGMYFSFNYGVSFEEHMKLDSLQHPLICEYLLSIAQALDHLHSHGFIYKDLKPNNIIIQSANPKAQLIDLGMARLEKFDDDNRFCKQITPPETVLASKDSPLTTKCDVWGFGVLIYEALSMGAAPFFPYDVYLPDYPTKVAAFCKNAPCAIERLVAQLSSRRQRLIRARDPFGFLLELTARCLHGDPKQRPSMSAITNSLSIYQQKLK